VLGRELARVGVSAERAGEVLAREDRAAVALGGLCHEEIRALETAARGQGLFCAASEGAAILAGPALLLREAARDLPPALGSALAAAAVEDPATVPAGLAHARGTLDLERPAVMGIVNVTPDSFSDGGAAFEAPAAIARGEALAEAGADVIDVGGESTRPGAAPVPADEELRRIMPVVEALARLPVPISIDTRKAAVARRALEVGAAIVNDVSALGDEEMAPLVARSGAGVVLMHMRGTPADMQADPRYDDLLGEIAGFLAAAAARAEAAGVAPAHVALDPGLGFGKTAAHNLEILARLEEIASLGYPVAIGISRKSTLGAVTGRPPLERLSAGVAAAALAVARGARIVRTHDVRETLDAVRIAEAILGAGAGPAPRRRKQAPPGRR
jgi:dihydropteroate synthase